MPTVKAPKQPKRKPTPFEKLQKSNAAHISLTRKMMAKIRAECKPIPNDPSLNQIYHLYETVLEVLDRVEMVLKHHRG